MTRFTIQNQWNGDLGFLEDKVDVELLRHPMGLLMTIEAPFYDDPAPPSNKGSFWTLWEYEVVEIFIVGSNGQYLEIECGPHGHYLCLELHDVRQVKRHGMTLDYSAKIQNEKWQGECVIPKELLPPPPHSVNLFAIHGINKDRTYFAWTALSGETPNFHQPSQFREAILPI
jgi:hypothetical protein